LANALELLGSFVHHLAQAKLREVGKLLRLKGERDTGAASRVLHPMHCYILSAQRRDVRSVIGRTIVALDAELTFDHFLNPSGIQVAGPRQRHPSAEVE